MYSSFDALLDNTHTLYLLSLSLVWVRPGRVHSRRMSLLSKYFTPSISATLCCLLLLFTEVVARRGVRNSLMQLNARSAYHPLHDLLAIGDNPSEDIRANIFLNMEGL